MKHSTAGSMTECYEPKVPVPCDGGCECVLKELYMDLCNLIVESRIPGMNDRGYGDGIHCPPVLGSSSHVCDPTIQECQKHQRLIHHLLRAVGSNIFEIEVLMLPECCAESKAKERIQNKEYVLLERWSMKCIYRAVPPSIDVSQLLRAVRSFLHFSQISAWLSSTKGQSPSNIYYWVKPSVDGSSTNFDGDAEEHSFPICKITEELYGSIKVQYPVRTEYVPIIPCSKHPPLRGYTIKTMSEDSSLCQTIPLNKHFARQMHVPCDNQQDMLGIKSCVPEPATLVLTQAPLLKSFTGSIPEGSKSNRVLKHSNCQSGLLNVSHMPNNHKNKTTDAVSKSQTTFVYNCAETFANGLSQENICFKRKRFAKNLRKTELKFRKLNKDSSVLYPYVTSSEESSDSFKPAQSSAIKRFVGHDVSFGVSNPGMKLTTNTILLKVIETSPTNELFQNQTSPHFEHVSRQNMKIKDLKRKNMDNNADKNYMLPQKKLCCDINPSSLLFKTFSDQIILSSESMKTSSIKTFNTSIFDCKHPWPSNLSHNRAIDYEVRPAELKLKWNRHSRYLTARTSENLNWLMQINNESNQNPQKNICLSISKLDVRKRLPEETCFLYGLDNETNASKKIKLCEDKLSNLPFEGTPCCSFDSSHCVGSSRNTTHTCELNNFLQKSRSKTKRDMYPFQDISTNPDFEHLQGLQFSESICKPQNLNKYKNILLNSASSVTNLKSKCTFFNAKSEKNSQIDEAKINNEHVFLKSSQTGSRFSAIEKQKLILEKRLFDSCHIAWDSNVCRKRRKKISSKQISLDDKNTKHENRSLKTVTKWAISKKTRYTNSSLVPTNQRSANKLFKQREKLHRTTERNVKNEMYKNRTYKQIMNLKPTSSHCDTETFSVSLTPLNSYQEKHIVPKISSTTRASQMLHTNTSSTADLGSKTLSGNASSKIGSQYICHTYPDSISKRRKTPVKEDNSLFIKTLIPFNDRNLYCTSNEGLECFPRHISKFPKGRKLLGNFEESILKGCLPTLNSVKGFRVEIGASGSFCPNHLTLPADVCFYELGNSHHGTAPYVAHVILVESEYYLPRKGAVQITLLNPSGKVVKMFVLNYDLSNMPPLCHTFIRQKIYSLPVGSSKEHPSSQKWLRFIIHLRFASSRTGKIYLYEDFKIVVLNKTYDDAASEFNQEPRELCSFLSVPKNPTFSSF